MSRITRRDMLRGLIAAGVAIAAAGCGATATPTTAPKPTTAPAPAGATPAPAMQATPKGPSKKVTITVWTGADREAATDSPKQDVEVYNYFKKWWTDILPPQISPNITVKREVVSGDWFTKITAAYKAGQAPDLSFMTQPIIAEMMTQGALLPMPDGLFDMKKEYGQKIADQYLWNGKYYTVPSYFWGRSMYYNEKILKDFGYAVKDIPNKWEDLIKFAKTMTKRDSTGALTMTGIASSGGATWDYYTTINDNLGGFFFTDKTHSGWDKGEMEEAWRFTKSLCTDYKLDDLQGEAATDRFFNGKAALVQQQYWLMGTARHKYVSLYDIVGAVPSPTYNGLPPRGWIEPSASYAVTTQSKDADVIAACWEVFKVLNLSDYWLSDVWYNTLVPARIFWQDPKNRPSWAPADHWVGLDDRFWGACTKKVTIPGEGIDHGFFAQPVFDYLSTEFDLFWLKDKSPKDALAAAAAKVNEFLPTNPGSQLTLLSKADWAAHPAWSDSKVPIKSWWDGKPFKPAV